MIIPAERLAPWEGNVGVPGGIPTRTTINTDIVADWGAASDGTSDVSGIIHDAMNACASGEVVQMPEGEFKLSSRVYLTGKSNVTLRGAGVGRTIIRPDNGNQGYLLFGSAQYPAPDATQQITAGATKGSTTVSVPSTADFYVGLPIGFAPALPSWAHNLGGLGNDWRTLRVTCRVVSKTGSTITFEPPLPFDFSGMDPYAQPYYGEAGYNLITGIGIEGITFDLTDSDVGWAIEMNQAWGCWVKNCEIKGSGHRLTHFTNLLRSEIRRCYMHDSALTGPNHEGLSLDGNCCWNLIEDNIFSACGSIAIILGESQGSNSCNVIAYNYMRDPLGGYWDLSCNHAVHSMLNLIEGNVLDWYKDDGYFGSSSHNTLLRNRIKSQISLKHFSNYYNIVGNVIGSLENVSHSDGTFFPPNTFVESEVENYQPPEVWPCYELGFPNIGNQGYDGTIAATDPPDYSAMPNTLAECQQLDLNVKATILRHGNFDVVTDGILWDSGIADHDLPDSIFRASQPAWWPEGWTFPAIDPATTEAVNGQATEELMNPAAWAYFHQAAGLPQWPDGPGSTTFDGEGEGTLTFDREAAGSLVFS